MNCKQSTDLEWPAPAKLNLFIHIIGRRQDGYHFLQTVFQLLDYGDSLRFDIRKDGRIRRCIELPKVDQAQDLTVRAARLLQKVCNTRYGVDIYLIKRLPMGGGLGGGSSDAATTLVALNYLWRCGLSARNLMSLGSELGADVPVFIYGHSSWAEGVGERLQTLELPERWYVVLKPAVEISTADVFSAAELTRNCSPITIEKFFSGKCRNVFEPVVRNRYPEVANALDWLDNYCNNQLEKVSLTGTGSCVYAACGSYARAQNIAAEIPVYWQCFIAKGINQSTLVHRLEEARMSE